MELTKQTAESIAAAADVLNLNKPSTPADHVRAWRKKAQRAYQEATVRAWRFDWAAFLTFVGEIDCLVD